MRARPLGLIVPTRWEAAAIFRRFKFRFVGHALFLSDIHGRGVLLCISGVGSEAARRASDYVVSRGAKELVSLGFCGALVPTLKVGDLVTDRIVTVDKPVRTPEERRALTERANAVAVDMETRTIIEVGTLRGVPIRILRVVSDEFQDDLTPLFGKSGSFSTVGIALRLLNPKVWPLAAKLKKQSRIASARLAEELEAFAKQES